MEAFIAGACAGLVAGQIAGEKGVFSLKYWLSVIGLIVMWNMH